MFSFDTDTQVTHWWMDIIRGLFALIDRAVYSLLMVIYQIFFTIADTEILTGDTVADFYNRVQVIIGIFMIFKVSVSLLQSVMDPERLTNKDTGMGKIISRILIMLAMFAALRPLNIPNAVEGTYNGYLKNNGLLFGTLYSFQSRVIGNNVLGKLLLPSTMVADDEDIDKDHPVDTSTTIDKAQSAKDLANSVLKVFVRINLKEDASEDGADNPDNYMCRSGWDQNDEDVDTYKVYNSKKSSPSDILGNINDWCTGPNGTDDNYSFVYTPIISTICGAVLVVVLLGFCIDIAVRALKLAILRLLAPIPIISYIDPKSAKDGSFASWVKTLTSTYLDLFLRLAIIYFALFVVNEVMADGLNLPSGIIGAFAKVFIVIGIFIFARVAPKFIKDALGLKGTLSNYGLSALAAGAGAIRAGGNFHDALGASRDAVGMQQDAFNQGKQGPGLGQSFTNAEDNMAKELTGNDKMSYQRMRRGSRALRREGLTAGRVEDEKNKMYNLQDEAEMAKTMLSRLNQGGWGNLTQDEQQAIEGLYRKKHHIGDGPLSEDQMVDMVAHGATDYYNMKKTEAGKQEALYKDMQNELDRHGGSRNSYRAKRGDLRDRHPSERNTQFSDLLTHEGRDAMRTGSFRETMRNVASIPTNATLNRADRRNARRDERIGEDQDAANVTNQNMDAYHESRNNRNNP